ncbi:hypothetical protein [Vagococcus sp.]|uniref:hypothetical protein n=1 Tax=Vagococcus sp. TaxID=1933889 RepID=UPI003F9B3ADD
MRRRTVAFVSTDYSDEEFNILMKRVKQKAKTKGISATNYMLKALSDSLEEERKEEKNNMRLELTDIMYKLNYIIAMHHIAGLSTCSLNINERVDSYEIFEESYNKLSGIKFAEMYAEERTIKETNEIFEKQSKQKFGTFYEKKKVVAPPKSIYDYDYKSLLRDQGLNIK